MGGRKRGHHKIIIGAAPGVGKTYRMLQEAHHLKRQHVDVVVGYFEPHDRPETMALLTDLELIPRCYVNYKSVIMQEMDCEAILKRMPNTVLVDELAHTNVPGSQRAKRYQDVEMLLDAGINVISTINIQHIESLNDVVSRITGVQVNERVPDKVLDEADEVVLVDISVEELQARLKSGKIYDKTKIEHSLNHFFKKGNLVALRELALREVADSVEERADHDMLACPDEPTGIHERIMVCISSHPNAQRLIRRGFRIADRLGGEFIVLYVQLKDKPLPEDYQKSLDAHKMLTATLGGQYIELSATHIAEAIVKEAVERKITQIVVGESLREPGIASLLKPALPYQIFQKTRNIDILIVATDRE